jgi:hypothetical protein
MACACRAVPREVHWDWLIFLGFEYVLLRKLVYRRIDGINLAACDSCAWTFNPENLEADSLEELKAKFQVQKLKDFAQHNCREFPKEKI